MTHGDEKTVLIRGCMCALGWWTRHRQTLGGERGVEMVGKVLGADITAESCTAPSPEKSQLGIGCTLCGSGRGCSDTEAVGGDAVCAETCREESRCD